MSAPRVALVEEAVSRREGGGRCYRVEVSCPYCGGRHSHGEWVGHWIGCVGDELPAGCDSTLRYLLGLPPEGVAAVPVVNLKQEPASGLKGLKGSKWLAPLGRKQVEPREVCANCQGPHTGPGQWCRRCLQEVMSG